MVEEAGQVLEAHILASLVPSGELLCRYSANCQLKPAFIQCINSSVSGTPNSSDQIWLRIVRTSILYYFGAYFNSNRSSLALSMDSAIGNELYKFDRSLMERLADSKYPMSQINVQRRMRPEISHFIR